MKTKILVFGILLILDFCDCSQHNEKRTERDLQSLFDSILGQFDDETTTAPTPNDDDDDDDGTDLAEILGPVDENDANTPMPIPDLESTTKGPEIKTTNLYMEPIDDRQTSTTIKPPTTPIKVASPTTSRAPLSTANKVVSSTANKVVPSTTPAYLTNGSAMGEYGDLSIPTSTSPYLIASEDTAKTTSKPLETTTSTELLPPVPTFDPTCEADDILSTYCPDLPPAVSTLSFWDIYYTFFSDMVLEALLMNCSSGHWCLKDRFNDFEAILMEKTEMVMTSEVFADVCQEVTGRCLQSVVDMTSHCSTYERTNFTKEAIDLICKLKKDVDLDINCFEELLISLHVTVVDILRDQNNKQQTVEAGFVDDTCETPETQMSKTFVCLEDRCPGHSADLANFRSWKWFTPDVRVLQDECDFEDDTCISKYRTVSSTEANTHQIGIAWTEPVGIHTMIGISVGTLVSVIALTVVSYVCWKSHRKAKKSKEGYSPLRNEEP